jgi:chorismate mutase
MRSAQIKYQVTGNFSTRGLVMTEEKTKYFVVKQKAVPEVLLKVVEAKKLLESEQVMTVQEAAERVGISRSSFYKYKDDILPFYDNTKGKTVTFVMQMDDRQGLLSDLLHVVAIYRANILTIHQSIPVNGVATLTLSVEVKADTGNISQMVEEMEEQQGIHYVKILARE